MNIIIRRCAYTVLFLSYLFTITACVAEGDKGKATDPYYRVAGELIVDAVPGAKMYGHQMFADGMGQPFYSSAITRKGNRSASGFPLPRIPKQVRVIWRGPDRGWDKVKKEWNDGTVAGDYTIPVASRIPEKVLEEVRKNGGGIRIKFRLKSDGVMLGWDIQREGKGKYTFDYVMAGGDYREARIYNGQVERKGWYIDKAGQKVETDY